MMKGLICYYSGSGNTKLACQYLVKNVPAVEWALCDIVKEEKPDFSFMDVIGFATFTDFGGVPQKFIQFINGLAQPQGRLAFTLTTFGLIGAFALRDLSRLVRAQGFKIMAGFSLHTPESYPPMICRGMPMENSPSPKEKQAFEVFLTKLQEGLNQYQAGKSIKGVSPGENILLSLFPAPKRITARKDMGDKYVDETICTKCRTCEQGCPYQAIVLEPYPQFDQAKCFGCWRCYNRCPRKAIYTKKFRNRGHYPRPIPQLVEKLLVSGT